MPVFRRAAAVGVLTAALALTACAPALPPLVVPGSTVTVAWSGELTSFNAAAVPTPGNIDIAAATRASFGSSVDGEFVADESFGTVRIVSEDPFTVRYDLAEPVWSDRIPLDAADLLLGWAAGAGILGESEGEDRPDAPTVDEFSRAIDVTFAAPTIGWQSAISVAVPAHVVGQRAFDLDDPMEAKQAVIEAIESEDVVGIAAIADVWANDFAAAGATPADEDLRLSSGPYLVEGIESDDAGQRVTLAPNPTYTGAAVAQVEDVVLTPPAEDPIASVGESADVVTVRPSDDNRDAIRERERRDFGVQTTHDGTMWAVVMSADGVFGDRAARAAFLRAVPADDMVAAGAGVWAQAYTKTTSMVTAPESRAFEIVNEDSGFAEVLGTAADDAALDRAAAGVADRARVCVLYDRRSAFASRAFAALRTAADEGGWSVADCGTDDLRSAVGQSGWDAVIDRVRIPTAPAEIAAQWGTDGAASLTGTADATRDDLIARLSQTVDVYEARELLASIESTIVNAALAKPLAVVPRITITSPALTGVTMANGDRAPLLSGITQWTPGG